MPGTKSAQAAEHRRMAEDCFAQAAVNSSPEIAAEFREMGAFYIRRAETLEGGGKRGRFSLRTSHR